MADSLLDDMGDHNPNDRAEIEAKWKDKPQDELLKAKVESDLYIKSLTARMDDISKDYLALKEQSAATASFQELIARQEAILKGTQETPPDTNTGHVNQPSLKTEDIDAMLEQKLTARELQNKQTTNFNMIKSKLREKFGDNASSILKQRMDTLGLDQAFTDDLAKNHPSVFIRTFGMDEPVRQDNFQTPPRSNQRQTSFAPHTPKRDWNYYQELKKSDPRLYLDPKIAVQMHNDAIELGDAFGMPED